MGSNSIVFADRPFRAAGHVLTKHFLKEWDEGSDSFAKDPPNATISVLSAEGDAVEDAVVVLKSPKLEGDKLTFEVTVLEEDCRKRRARLRCSSTGSQRAVMAVEDSSPAAIMAAGGMAPGMVYPGWDRRRGRRGRAWRGGGRSGSRERLLSSLRLSLSISRRHRRPAATTPIRPATEREQRAGATSRGAQQMLEFVC